MQNNRNIDTTIFGYQMTPLSNNRWYLVDNIPAKNSKKCPKTLRNIRSCMIVNHNIKMQQNYR